jgi:hypothetical protein
MSSSIASDAGPVIGTSPASQRRIVRSPFGPSRRASASPVWERPRDLRAARSSAGFKGRLARDRVELSEQFRMDSLNPFPGNSVIVPQTSHVAPEGSYVSFTSKALFVAFGSFPEAVVVHSISPSQAGQWPKGATEVSAQPIRFKQFAERLEGTHPSQDLPLPASVPIPPTCFARPNLGRLLNSAVLSLLRWAAGRRACSPWISVSFLCSPQLPALHKDTMSGCQHRRLPC